MAENKLADLSMDFAISILKVTDGIKGHYSLINQLERSATSNIKRNVTYYREPTPELMILRELHSKCKQIRYERLESFTKDVYEDFASFAVKYDINLNKAN